MEKHLSLLLRIIGSASLTALIFVVVPNSWMNATHLALGMGKLPDAPIVSYLARSTSAFYAMVGGLLWVISFDLPRYRKILTYLGYSFVIFGVALTFIDWIESMPLYWKVWEGPFVIVFGLTILFLNSRLSVNNDG